jgi:hypothetical protein
VAATESNDCIGALPTNFEQRICTAAAQWGADQELEACCEYLVRCAQWEFEDVAELCAARRPKQPSLKEQALEAARIELLIGGKNAELIIRALEALPDD